MSGHIEDSVPHEATCAQLHPGLCINKDLIELDFHSAFQRALSRIAVSGVVQLRVHTEDNNTTTHTLYCAMKRERPKTSVLVPLVSLDRDGDQWEMQTWGDINECVVMTLAPSEVVKFIIPNDNEDPMDKIEMLQMKSFSSNHIVPGRMDLVADSAWEPLWTKEGGAARASRNPSSTPRPSTAEQSMDDIMMQGLQSLTPRQPSRTSTHRQPQARVIPHAPNVPGPRRQHHRHDAVLVADPEDSDDLDDPEGGDVVTDLAQEVPQHVRLSLYTSKQRLPKDTC